MPKLSCGAQAGREYTLNMQRRSTGGYHDAERSVSCSATLVTGRDGYSRPVGLEEPLERLRAFQLDALWAAAREDFHLDAAVREELDLPALAGHRHLDGERLGAEVAERVVK